MKTFDDILRKTDQHLQAIREHTRAIAELHEQLIFARKKEGERNDSPLTDGIDLDATNYIVYRKHGRKLAQGPISSSKWHILRLLLDAGAEGVLFSTLIASVPVWTKNEPDDGAIKRMLSKISSEDFEKLGIPFEVKTRKDRRSGNSKAFLVDVSPEKQGG